MGVLSDTDIVIRTGMIEDMQPGDPRPGIISYGVTSYGYDARLAPEYKVFVNIHNKIMDPKGIDPHNYVDKKGDTCIIPPNGFILGRTIEKFNIPRDILALCMGKSSYARCGICVNVTPLEPEWSGHVTLEIQNATGLPAIVYANEGICQFVFLKCATTPCFKSYKDKGGIYQGQTGITLARVK